ncbi:hypothetical protein CYMTET_26768 [Cymbomonas tetramitiformis]|uniref:Uncharacterized protein n=1 Tax=Cymbomonas tetramitiformis TaxID=36881 RepID=A0AAE0FR43_9CHLO|nr:hypothetical protein CYMTET_26768 [Cymbomonas tetramitiformis]
MGARTFSSRALNCTLALSKIVTILQPCFVAEGLLAASLFALDDAVVVVRVEANKLLFSTFELIAKPRSPATDWLEESVTVSAFDGKRVLLDLARWLLQSGGSFQGATYMIGVRFRANEDRQDGIADFNAALTAARRKNTLDDEEVHGDSEAVKDLAEIIFQFGKQLKRLEDKVKSHGFPPWAEKPTYNGRELKYRFAVKPLNESMNFPQSDHKKVAFHKESGKFIPTCQNRDCASEGARHFHRNDCPNWGARGASMASFVPEDVECDVLAWNFQLALNLRDEDRFSARVFCEPDEQIDDTLREIK